MNKTVTMDAPATERRLDDMVQGLVGKPLDRPDGPRKVTGTATYAHEWNLAGRAYGVFVPAPFARGTITSLDTEAVEAMDGVLRVITDARFLRNPAQGTANEAPIQGWDDVHYMGQPVALVVAESFEAARHGAQNLSMTWEARDATLDPDTAPTDAGEDFAQGDLDAAMKNAHASVDATYRTPGHNSAAMEPHCSAAVWHGDELTLYGSYQMVNFNVNELADALGIDAEKVHMRVPYVGGGFGSKLGIAPEAVAAAIAAKELDRPVVVALSRPQVFEATMRRSETRQRLRLAADADGRLTGIGHEALVSNLTGEEFSEPVTQSTHFLYAGKHRKLAIDIARLNRTCAGSVRAPGEAVGMPTLENAMDELAEKLGIDPIELRKRNLPDCHPESGLPYSSRKYAEAMDAGAKAFGWDQRNRTPGARREGEWLIGHGMAGASRVNMIGPASARVTLDLDDAGQLRATVETDMTDIGTGTYAILSQIAGEMLGLPMDRVTARLGNSDHPSGSGSGGSIGASSTGSAVFLACEDLRAAICARLGCDEGELTLKDGTATAGNVRRALGDILDGEALSATGTVQPGDTASDVSQASYGAYFCEVAVNAVTGETRVRRMTGAFGAGRILNAKTATSQCYGGMTWGIGMALTEELIHDARDGHIVNADLAEYHVPVNLDVPQLDVILLDERDDWACPIQTKGIGELGFCGAAGAVLNAIYNATGVRVRHYPATLDKIIAELPEPD
ncbi:xanthine dehydrogenase YagR molybdenum-binding subunit [Roseovarius nanhaiticus]|uniref:Xanthine dehydrogenase YagR molybdenum-binding subunit n=1 Tax=Roseovarius nanhaiticus TaxID=573024 RepID=A0A1N7HMS6_9RHOB|nr:xanthine dehydrogenase family protein molybdopterin-binding subunit [Roseovarius nanhaiticus]SEL37130.1 xanthine dehydrogenase YagR molybdenum-binding subunit [Roseovarius nanhaiticus]SIS26185.1 xanthine dehydrogenase YagR molybdenum-binding subunit [Roseovarius nanhaiticus]